MKPKKRQKLCHHCEGEVDLDVIVCPFCAADLREERPDQPKVSTPLSSMKNSTEHSLYPSTYQEPAEPTVDAVVQETSVQPTEQTKPAVYGLLLFALGAQMFFLAIAFLLFSERGVLLLQFNASWWPLCLSLATLFLFFGYRLTKEL